MRSHPLAKSPAEILAALDAEQRRAVEAPIGAVRIIAGAGTGKTRTLIHRIAYWDAQGDAPANKVLAVTHSNKSAAELRFRLNLLGVREAQAQTFHAAALRQLKFFWPQISLGRDFPELLKEGNQYWEIRRATEQVLKLSGRSGTQKREFDSAMYQSISSELTLARSQMFTPDTYRSQLQLRGPGGVATKEEFAKIFSLYTQSKRSKNLVDFPDLLDLSIEMIENSEEISLAIQERYQHFLVDEFQDNDPVQERLLKAWLGERKSICVVGDPRQTIYSFKGADPSILNLFDTRFTKSLTVALVRNYRSTVEVVEWANKLMRSTTASGGESSELISECGSGPVPIVYAHSDEDTEMKKLAERIHKVIASSAPKITFADVAVLVRIGSSVPLIRSFLRAANIPSKSPGDTFWEDVEPILRRLNTSNSRSLSVDGLSGIRAILISSNWWSGNEADGEIDPRRRDLAEALLALAGSLKEEDRKTPAQLLQAFQRMQSESIDDRNHDAVTVTTIHKAKGLEWEAVFIPRFVAGVLPINFAQTPAALDEELRLAYVGVTRAKRHLTLSWSSSYEAFNKVRTQSASGFLALLQDPPQLRQRTVEVSYLLGGKVADDRFGLGTITKIEGTYLTIDFGSGGLRRIPKLDPKLDLL